MPAVFLGHGSPMNTLETNPATEAWAALGADLPQRPAAVLAISAHWYVRGLGVTAMERPRTIHDFSGFPPELSQFRYPAPGSPALAARVAELLAPLEVVADTTAWGLDHGTWSVLAHVFPAADVPVVQLAIDARRPAAWHAGLGARLAPLRDEGVLVVGSGNIVHNLGAIRWGMREPLPWAERFDRHIADALDRGDLDTVTNWDRHPDAALAVPTPEHYLPLVYVAAMRAGDDGITTIVAGHDHGSLSMRSVRIG
jgi:4,5-DOPA dioxygenase extradiol